MKKFNYTKSKNLKAQAGIEYPFMIIVVIILISIALFFLMNVGKSTTSSANYKGEILNATMVYSPAGDNIGPGNLSNTGTNISEYLLIATNYPLPNIPKNAYSSLNVKQTGIPNTEYIDIFFSQPFTSFNLGNNFYYQDNIWYNSYNQGNITEIYSQNGEYVYAVNMTGYTSSNYSIPPLSYITISINGKNTTLIANPKPLKINFIETNSTYIKILPVGSIGKNLSDVATFIITGLPINSNVTLSYYNTSQNLTVNENILINSSTVVKTVNAFPGIQFFSSVPSTISYNGIKYIVSVNSSNYTVGSTINYNYYQLSTSSIKYLLNKPLVNGAEIKFNIPASYYYSENPFSNLEISVGNAIANGGTLINAFVANYTSTSITLNLGNITSNDIQTVYLNFLPDGYFGSDIGFSPEYSSENSDVSFAPPSGIFVENSYYDNGGNWYSPSKSIIVSNTIDTAQFYGKNILSATSQNTEYVAGINMFSGYVDSIGFNVSSTNITSTNANLGSLQAPYPGAYLIGSSDTIFLDSWNMSSQNSFINNTFSPNYDYIGEIGINYSISENTITINAFSTLNGVSGISYYTYNTIPSNVQLSIFGKAENILTVYYMAQAINPNIFNYIATEVN